MSPLQHFNNDQFIDFNPPIHQSTNPPITDSPIHRFTNPVHQFTNPPTHQLMLVSARCARSSYPDSAPPTCSKRAKCQTRPPGMAKSGCACAPPESTSPTSSRGSACIPTLRN